ncbi:hypothetical protein Tco_1174649 [Tanacetum coccineum]
MCKPRACTGLITSSKDQIISTLDHGLELALDIHKKKVVISPFGYDDSVWDPSRDKFLPQFYSANYTRGKSIAKAALQQHIHLPADIASVIVSGRKVGCIFSERSDVDMENLKSLALASSRKGVQYIFVGISKISGTKSEAESFQEGLNDENVKFLDDYEESLLHLIFAGSDIILCNFNDPMLQVSVKAIKYEAVPVPVNIADSRLRLSEYIINTFANVSLSQALDEIKNKPSQWNRKVMDAMSKDVSWEAECYDIHVSAYTSLKE